MENSNAIHTGQSHFKRSVRLGGGKSRRDLTAVYRIFVRRLNPIPVRLRSAKTSFLPHSKNKTTSVAQANFSKNQPRYLINTEKNEVIRSIMRGNPSSTEVVMLLQLGENKVVSDSYVSSIKSLTINH